MVPARNLLRRHYDTYGGGGCFDIDSSHFTKQSPLRSNLMMMAEHQPSTTGDPAQEQTTDQEQEQVEAAAGTSSIAKPDDSWLQLGIGLGASSSSSSSSSAPSRPSVELELFSDRPSSSFTSSLPTVSLYRPTGPQPTPPMFSSMAPPPQQWGYRPPPWGFWNSNLMQYNTAGGSSSRSTPPPMMMMLPPPQFYNVQRFPLPPPAAGESGGPRFGEMRVVSPPAAARQQHVGVWFLLRAAENQVREPFLPQIPKSYIRIKDGRMTVRLLMKYLVKKLGLDDESEVQISCRGQPLLPFLTLQHVRDNIWCLSEAVAFLPDSPSIDHVMTLQYGRSP